MFKLYIGMKNRKKELLNWAITIGVILLLWITGWYRPLISTVQRGILATGIFQPKINEVLDYEIVDAHFLDEHGELVSLSDIGGRVIFLNIWATWCPPCRAEMPSIQSLYNETYQDVEFIMLSIDKDFEKAVAFKKEHGFTFLIYKPVDDLPGLLHTQTIPATFVFDKEGQLKMSQEGMANYNSKRFKRFIKDLISL